jgi:hypothetical protein
MLKGFTKNNLHYRFFAIATPIMIFIFNLNLFGVFITVLFDEFISMVHLR